MPELSERMCFTLDAELGSQPPEEVQLLPHGEVSPRGKTAFVVDDTAVKLIMEAFASRKTDLVVDYEHQSLAGTEAPAAGWIKELFDRGDGGLWAKVAWTDRAVSYLQGREYRYISPVVLVRKSDGRAVELLGAGLTNLPAIDGMVPVVNTAREGADEGGGYEGGYEGLFKGALRLMSLPENADLAAVEAKLSTLADPDGFVPRSEYEALKQTLRAAEAEAMVKEALTDGRLTPSHAAWAMSYAMTDPEGFGEYIGKACKVVPVGAGAFARPPATSHAQSEVNRLLGVGHETFVRYGRDSDGEA